MMNSKGEISENSAAKHLAEPSNMIYLVKEEDGKPEVSTLTNSTEQIDQDPLCCINLHSSVKIESSEDELTIKLENIDYEIRNEGADIDYSTDRVVNQECPSTNYESTIVPRNSILNTKRDEDKNKILSCYIKLYKCNDFPNQAKLTSHIRTHTGKELFKCSYCHKRFSRKDHLIKHIRIHTGEKPFKCRYCHKRFSRKDYLVKHIRTHTGKELFKWSDCDGNFCNSGQLGRHLRTHTGEKPFKCSYCHNLGIENEEVSGSSKLLTSANRAEKSTEELSKGKKPLRPCPYCPDFKLQSNLKRHLMRRHNAKVKHILTSSAQKQRNEFKKLRLEGVFQYNKLKKSLFGQKANLQRARKPIKDDKCLKMCSACYIFVSEKTFRRHKCINKSPVKRSGAMDVTQALSTVVTDQEFLEGCINKL